jgi:hypothetical protein
MEGLIGCHVVLGVMLLAVPPCFHLNSHMVLSVGDCMDLRLQDAGKVLSDLCTLQRRYHRPWGE